MKVVKNYIRKIAETDYIKQSIADVYAIFKKTGLWEEKRWFNTDNAHSEFLKINQALYILSNRVLKMEKIIKKDSDGGK